MKKITLIAISLFLSLGAFCQPTTANISFKWGGQTDIPSMMHQYYSIIGQDASGMYALRSRIVAIKFDYVLEHYDQNMNLTKKVNLDLGQKSILAIKMFNNKMYLISYEQKNKKWNLFVQTINKKTLTPNNDIKEIESVDQSSATYGRAVTVNGPLIYIQGVGMFGMAFSNDSSKVLIYHDLPYNNNKATFAVHVFDYNMKQLWKQDVLLNTREDMFKITDYTIDNSGKVYVLAKLYRGKKKNKGNYDYEVLSYANQGNQVSKHIIVCPDTVVMNRMRIAVTPQQNVICAGFYSKQTRVNVRGIVYQKINGKTGAVMASSFDKFSNKFILQDLSKKDQARDEKQLKKARILNCQIITLITSSVGKMEM